MSEGDAEESEVRASQSGSDASVSADESEAAESGELPSGDGEGTGQ